MKKLFGHKSKLNLEEKPISFCVNDKDCIVKPGDLSPTLSLARYIRDHLNLKGTKISCAQAGCGACVVTAYMLDKDTKQWKAKSVNSCITPVLSCDGWYIVTVEGLGSRKNGMHPVQERLAAFHGTQCGFCSPGMVMQMHSYLEENPNGTMKEIEHILDGNICRCTGYRPIHDAFKSFAADASDSIKKQLADIEDAGGCQGKGKKICPRTGTACGGGGGGCKVGSSHSVAHQKTMDGEWYMPETLEDLLSILEHLPENCKYRLVGGNTGTGIYQDGPYDVYVDVKKVKCLSAHSTSPLELGGGMSLNDIIALMDKLGDDKKVYSYGKQVATHIRVVANTAVRNTGTLAGNLMLKHAHNYFPSDLFIMLESLGANIIVASAADGGKESKYSPAEWLKISMDRKLIVKVALPALSPSHVFRSFKITPRSVNAHAYVNSGMLFNVGSKEEGYVVKDRPSICFGGITHGFVHASQTEEFLTGKKLADVNTLKGALGKMKDELKPHPAHLEANPEYRRNLAQSLLYKVILGIVDDMAAEKLRSGALNITRDISKGQQSYKMDSDLWPVNKNIPKLEGQSQCTGEAQYIDDIPHFPGELHGALVLATQANCEIDKVDTSEALKMSGVEAYVDHTDIPGTNTWVPLEEPEEIFSSGKIHYAGQTIGLIVADTVENARAAAKAVKVTYKNQKKVIIDIKEAMKHEERVITKLPDFFGFAPKETKIGNTKDYENDPNVIKVEGEFAIGSQYHFYMETQAMVCRPVEDNQLEMFAGVQWMDFTQNMVCSALGIQRNQLDIKVRRLGGGYGGKCVPPFLIACVTAIACYKLNKAVRLILDLQSNMEFTGKRDEYLAKYKAGVDKEGHLKFVDLTFCCGTGWSSAESLTLAECIPFAQNCYNSASWSMTPLAIIVDRPRSTACRAPGTTQGHAVIENVMEHLAAKLNMDPTEFRLKNMLKDGDMQISGEPFKGDNPLPALIEKLKKTADYQARRSAVDDFNKANLWKKRGISLVPVKYGVHYTPFPFYCHISIFEGDGTIAVSHGGIEMGQGINTKVAQTVAMELGVPMDMIIVKPAETLVSPNNCVTGGSSTSELTCNAARVACQDLKERMKRVSSAMEGSKWNEIIQACFFQGVDLTARHMGNSAVDKLQGYQIWAVCLTEVEIDLLTGERNIVRTDIMEDTGAAMNPEVDVGQIEGGYVFALGMWLQEKITHDPDTGKLLTNDTWEYKPPTCYDIPQDLRTTLVDTNRMEGILGSKATGEPSMLMGVGVIFAIRDAVNAARKDLNIKGPTPSWYNLSGPLTVENLQLASGVTPDHFKY